MDNAGRHNVSSPAEPELKLYNTSNTMIQDNRMLFWNCIVFRRCTSIFELVIGGRGTKQQNQVWQK